MRLCGLDFSAAEVLLVLLQVGFDVSEFVEQLVVLQNLDVLDMEVSFVVTLELLVWVPWVDSFEDAQLAEVLQVELESANRI